jgi:replicative DNA helicase
MSIYEQKLIGGVASGMVKPSDLDLDFTDFSDKDLGAVFGLAKKLESDRIEIDIDVLNISIIEKTSLYYSDEDFRLMAKSAQSRSVVFDALQKVKGAALKSFLLTRSAEIALKENRTGTDLLDDLKNIVAEAEKNYSTSENSFQSIADLKGKVKALLTDLHKGISYAVPTYFPQIDDKLLDGFSKGDLHLIVGMTGAGKSSLALNYALNQAKHGHKVAIVSREMSEEENILRFLAAESGIGRFKMRKGMDKATYETLLDYLDRLIDKTLTIDTRTEDIETLSMEAMRMVESNNLEILYVDYLQLMSSKRTNDTRANEVQAISRELKKLAMSLNIPVVALVQFNNGVINASLFDVMNYIRESGSIKQDASTIQYVQVEQTEEVKEKKDAKMTVLKNRNGETFNPVQLIFKGAEFKFYEMREEYNTYGER